MGAGEMTGRNLQHHRVPVKTDQRTFGADATENLATVPRGPHRPVDHRQPGSELQRVQRLAQQDGNMDRTGRNNSRPTRQAGVFRHDRKMREQREDDETGGSISDCSCRPAEAKWPEGKMTNVEGRMTNEAGMAPIPLDIRPSTYVISKKNYSPRVDSIPPTRGE